MLHPVLWGKSKRLYLSLQGAVGVARPSLQDEWLKATPATQNTRHQISSIAHAIP